MWEQLVALMRMMWDAGKKAEAHSNAIDELQDRDQRLIQALNHLASQNDLLRKDNEALRQALQHERELREREIANVKLELRLQIAEELRRLPPAEEK